MRSGGSDPAIVARMIDLQAEAQSLEKTRPASAGKSKTQSDAGQEVFAASRCITTQLCSVEPLLNLLRLIFSRSTVIRF